MNVVSSDIRVMQIFAGVQEIWGVKQFVSSYYISMISLHNAVARLTCFDAVGWAAGRASGL